MFTGLGKKQADTDLEMVVQGGMMSQKAKEGGKSVFYLPVMSSFIVGFPVYRGASEGIFGRDATGIRSWYLVREREKWAWIHYISLWMAGALYEYITYCLWMNVRGKSYGRPIWIGIWLLLSEVAAGWDFCLNTCESRDRETRISPVTRTWHTESSSKIKEPLLFKTSAHLGASRWDLQPAECICCQLCILPTTF